MKYFDKICFMILSFAFFFLIPQFCKKQTDTFTIHAISSFHPYNSEFETRPLTFEEESEVKKALGQPYTYHGQGGQAFIFFSKDGQYVIKFFKQRLFRPSWILNHLPLSPLLHRFRSKRNWKRKDKMQRDFFSYKTAFEQLKNETGILYAHLNPTNHLQTKLLVQDRLKIWHSLELDKFDFVVQKRAIRAYEKISSLMLNQQIEKAKQSIVEIFNLIYTRAEKGYRDRDPNIETNCGFIGDHAIKIDVGRFVRNEAMRDENTRRMDFLKIIAPFEEWIEERYPILLPFFKETKESFCHGSASL